MGSVIAGTGIAIPDRVVTNDDLARIMDTSDEWIATRTGVRRRHFARAGVGASDLATRASRAALDDAGLDVGDVDLIVTATMTPDSFAPGIAALVQSKLGAGQVAAYDLRQQCSGFLYGLSLADALLAAGHGSTALVVGAETHAGFLPFAESWESLFDEDAPPVDPKRYAANTEIRGWAVLFGDGAGAAVLRRHDSPGTGFLGGRLFTDGTHFDLIEVPGVGFRYQPYVDQAQLEERLHLPRMNGRTLFRQAVRLMPDAVRAVATDVGAGIDDIDVVVAHQANARIIEGVRRDLGVDESIVPVNIDRYGNTTAATLPILFHELRQEGRIDSCTLVAFTAFGAGAHWGAMLYREP
jgi:3-oxoacyl-[acyl-carrier-protein] synthase-3